MGGIIGQVAAAAFDYALPNTGIGCGSRHTKENREG